MDKLTDKQEGLLAMTAYHAQNAVIEYKNALEGILMRLDGTYAAELLNDVRRTKDYLAEIESMLSAKI